METSILIIASIGVIIVVGIVFKFFFKTSSHNTSSSSPERKLQGTLRARARVEEARDKNYKLLKDLESKVAAGGSEEAETLKAIMSCISEINKQESTINNLIADYNNIEVNSFKQRSFEVQRGGSQRAMLDYLLFLEADNAKTRDAIFELSDAIAEIEGGSKAAAAASSRGLIKGSLLTRRVSYRDRCINVESEVDAILKAMLNPVLRRRDAAKDGGLVGEAREALAGMLERERELIQPLVEAEKEFSAKFAIERRMKFERLCGVFGATENYLKKKEDEKKGNDDDDDENAIVDILAPLNKAVIPGVVDTEYKELVEKKMNNNNDNGN